jgi:hypothetical protein
MSRRIRRFERFCEPLISRSQFLARAGKHFALASGIIAAALAIGIVGYHLFDGLPWIDALVNASMILGGMGPVSELHGNAAKLFASFYALFAGLVFITAAGLLLGPWLHRLLHHFHFEDEP